MRKSPPCTTSPVDAARKEEIDLLGGREAVEKKQ